MRVLEQFFAGNTGLNLSKEHEQVLALTGELHAVEEKDRQLYENSMMLSALMGAESPVNANELMVSYLRMKEVRDRAFLLCCREPARAPELKAAFPGLFRPHMEQILIKQALAPFVAKWGRKKPTAAPGESPSPDTAAPQTSPVLG